MIISGAIVLAAGVDADAPLIGYRNVVTAAGVVATTEQADYPAVNVANPATHSEAEWRGLTATQHYLTITTDGLEPIDYVAIARHNFGTAQIAVSIEGPAGVWTQIVAPSLPAADNRPILLRLPSQVLPQFRIRMQAGSAAPRAAVVYAGQLLTCPRKMNVGHTPLPFARKTVSSNGFSQSGEFLGTIVTGAYRETVLPFSLIGSDDYRARLDAFLAASRSAPFFFAWRPASRPAEVGYCWSIDDPMPMADGGSGNLIGFTMTVRGVT